MYQSMITEPLGLYGWSHLEPVILAALASEAPMLLIGKHGSAKSFILETLAKELKMNYRCYNASLINYDDLVGIPIPINNNTSLSYISNQSSIWDAEVVFIDELNRTKVELQNKIFPIIYEKRVQGIDLNKLKYRWAAMNPPCKDDDFMEDEVSYLGANPIDPALADRFSYIIEVPTWDDLCYEDKEKMLYDNHEGSHNFPINIFELIQKTKKNYQIILQKERKHIYKYIINLMELLKNSFGYISSRRATILEDTLFYILAAIKTLNEYNNENITFDKVASIHILTTLPFITNTQIDKTLLISICNEAINLSKIDTSITKDILLTKDPIEKIKLLIKNKDNINNEEINDIITSSLNKITDIKKVRAMSLFLYLTFRTSSQISASVIETLAAEIRPILEVKHISTLEIEEKRAISDEIHTLLENIPNQKSYKKYLNNYLFSYFPLEFHDKKEVKEAYLFFVNTWEELYE